MISKIGIENFRIFKNYNEFDLAPITVLIGPNNSGKSSFLKLLSLLQYSFGGGDSLDKLNFDGGTHNLGSFDNVLNWDINSNELKLVLDFPLDHFDEKFQLELIYTSNDEYTSKTENGHLKSFKVFNKNRILFRYIQDDDLNIIERPDSEWYIYYLLDFEYIKYSKNKDGNFSNKDSLFFDYYKINENKNDKKTVLNKKYFQILSSIENSYIKYKYYPLDYIPKMTIDFFTDLIKEIPWIHDMNDLLTGLDHKGTDEKIDINFSELGVSEEEYNNFIEDIPSIKLKINDESYQYFQKYITDNIFKSLKKIKFSLNNFYLITANRGSKNRILNDGSTNEIDEIVKEFYQNSLKHSFYESFLKKSLEILKIEGEIEINRIEGTSSLISLKKKNGKNVNLSDLGYGYSQIIPILLKIINAFYRVEDRLKNNPYNLSDITSKEIEIDKKTGSGKLAELEINALRWLKVYDFIEKESNYPTLIIEEPEANLHPHLQSKLADILILAHKAFNIHFILETHSEYLIRKLQYLTAKKKIAQDNVVIYYFNEDENVNEKEPKVKEIRIDEFGALTDSFGPGFFDESTSLKFELMKLNQAQNN